MNGLAGNSLKPVVEIRNLNYSFNAYRKRTPKSSDEFSLKDINANIFPGEVLGVLGPNGAGKTTLIKLMSGLIRPTSGTVVALGTQPFKKEKNYLSAIALISGQRRQLTWDLPAIESYRLLKAIYSLSEEEYTEQVALLGKIFDIEQLLLRPVKTLSLGQRMRLEFVGSLLHRPKIVYMDEPTLGLDFQSRRVVWKFMREYVEHTGTAAVLTSHYMEDIEALANRTFILNRGEIVFDGSFDTLKSEADSIKKINIHFSGEVDLKSFEIYGAVERRAINEIVLTLHSISISEILEKISAKHSIDKFEVCALSVDELVSSVKVKNLGMPNVF